MKPSKNKSLPIEHYPFPAVLIDHGDMECSLLVANKSCNNLYGLFNKEALGQDLFGHSIFTQGGNSTNLS